MGARPSTDGAPVEVERKLARVDDRAASHPDIPIAVGWRLPAVNAEVAVSMPPPPLVAAAPMQYGSAVRTARALEQMERSLKAAGRADLRVDDIVEIFPEPLPFQHSYVPSDPWLLRPATAFMPAISDGTGAPMAWPWEAASATDPQLLPARRPHRVDALIERALDMSSARGDRGRNTTGVRRWQRFCAELHTPHCRPMEPWAPLRVRLEEEWLAMRFVATLAEEVQVNTASSYWGQVQGWHLLEHGVKIGAGMPLKRLSAMLKGLRRIYGGSCRVVRRGIDAAKLRLAMDRVLNPRNPEHAAYRALLTLMFQGLLRGGDAVPDGRFNAKVHLTPADIVRLDADTLVMMIRPCKNTEHLTGKTCPLIIGAGGELIDAVYEMKHYMSLINVDQQHAHQRPLFTKADGKSITVDDVRHMTRTLMHAVGEVASEFGAHSYRIGGASSLFAQGADPHVIRTMGRWSSDIWRIYVQACYDSIKDWTRRVGSKAVRDVAGEKFNPAEVDEY